MYNSRVYSHTSLQTYSMALQVISESCKGHCKAASQSLLYLLQVQHHLLWVWADASPNAQLECLAKQPAVIDELQEEDKVIYMHPW